MMKTMMKQAVVALIFLSTAFSCELGEKEALAKDDALRGALYGAMFGGRGKPSDQEQVFDMTIYVNNAIVVNGEEVSLEQLKEKIVEKKKNTPNPMILIDVANNVSKERLDKILEVVNEQKISKIKIKTTKVSSTK